MDLEPQEKPSLSSYIKRIWYSYNQEAVDFTSMAEVHSGLVVTNYQGKLHITVRGPETQATPAHGPAGAQYVGIQFNPGVFLRPFPPSTVLDRADVNLPEASSRSFWLEGAAWEYPTYENADTFVDRLARAGYLVYEPLIGEVLGNKLVSLSRRTVQRRFLQATGLTYDTILQIEQARYAAKLLKEGVSILDTVEAAGYFDQPHLTRALKRRIGITPAQILQNNRLERLSFLYKTSPTVHAILVA